MVYQSAFINDVLREPSHSHCFYFLVCLELHEFIY